MARISELHYSNAYAAQSGVAEFIEIALAPSDDPADFSVAFYQSTGLQGVAIALNAPGVQVSFDADANEWIYVIRNGPFDIQLTDPDGNGATNYEAYALVDTATGTVGDFYDIGGGTSQITALDGLALGATSVNLPVDASPDATRSSLQFNKPDADTLSYGSVSPGETGAICFASGTVIETEDGPRAIEDLTPGIRVVSADHGLVPLRWIARQRVEGTGAFAPCRIIGGAAPLLVSPNHRMLSTSGRHMMLFGTSQALVAAKHLPGVARVPMPQVTYWHLMFDAHVLLRANGLWSESFYVADTSLATMPGAMLAEFGTLFPALLAGGQALGPMARPVLRHWEARLLAA